jgi:2'-5' RNA ligase
LRLFIAINFNNETKDTLCGIIEKLKAEGVRGSFTDRGNLHLTLAFIGESDKTAEIKSAMDSVSCRQLTVKMGGIGIFRRDGGHILWLGVDRNPDLSAAQRQLYDALTQSGFTLEDREFKPHLTLGRRVILPDGFDRTAFSAGLQEVTATVTSFDLMKSERCGGKMIYTKLYGVNLKDNVI